METYKHLPKSEDFVNVTVSGKTFSLSTLDVLAYPESVLAKSISAGNTESLSYGRPVSSFKAIVGLYQTGELHMPSNICPKEFENELLFWGFNVEIMEPCCLNAYRKFMDETKRIAAFQDAFRNRYSFKKRRNSWKEKIWLVLENQTSSKLATVYLIMALFFMILSMASLPISTVSEVMQPPDENEIRRYAEEKLSPMEFALFTAFLDSRDDGIHPIDAIRHELDDYHRDYEDSEMSNDTRLESEEDRDNSNNTKTKPDPDPERRKRKELFKKLRLDCLMRKSTALKVIDNIVLTFFTLELFIRLVTCPSISKYLKNPLNILDALVTCLALAEIAIEEVSIDERFRKKGIQVLFYFQILRVFRIFRIVKNVTAIQVLVFSFKTNYKDFLVLLLYIGITLLVFGCLIYFVEDLENIKNIPNALWFCLITMTTVGYGDLVPKSIPGKCIGGLCALTGVLLLALIIPVFVSTFVSVYEYARYSQAGLCSKVSDGENKHGHSLGTVAPLKQMTELKSTEKTTI